jgi:hypothetical protein
MHIRRPLAAATVLAAILFAGSIPAQASHLPESNAEALEILADYYPGYWWDHTDITVAAQAAPNVRPRHLAAVRDSIGTWDSVLREEFDDLITLTDVTDTARNKQRADIVLHYVPRAGGVVFGGYAICGAHRCPNIMVRSDFNVGQGRGPYTPEYLGWVTLHEIGHALGLGHATNLLESTDLMGYGWPDLGEPVLSDCDLDALRYVFGWAFEGTEPAPPPVNGPYDCSLD